jgi:hypothetical protein
VAPHQKTEILEDRKVYLVDVLWRGRCESGLSNIVFSLMFDGV